MQLIVGLGNPGNRYTDTRHNVGFRFLDSLAQREELRFVEAPRFKSETVSFNCGGDKVLLVKPMTFMNNSGEAVGALLRYYQVKPENVSVVFDDLDLAEGKLRFKKGGGHGGHNGLRSLNQHLETPNYTRVKVGIGRPTHGSVTDWVLGKTPENQRIVEDHIFNGLIRNLPLLINGDIVQLSNKLQPALQQLTSSSGDS